MFQPQEESADYEYPRGPLKRYHEEEEAAAEGINGSTIGFTEHRNKRLHTLPFRTSPTARKWSLSNTSPFEGGHHPDPAMTPPGSFSEGPPQAQRELQQAQYVAMQQHQSIYGHQGSVPAVVESGDMDMDMASDEMLGSAAQYGEQHHHLAPGPAQPDQDSIIASRMPTPIQPSFAAQVRGNNWGGAAGNIMHNNIAISDRSATEDRTVPRTLDHPAVMGEWSMVQNRSLPSPISESGIEEAGSPDMVLDSMALQGLPYDQSGHEQIEGCGEHDNEIDQTPDRSSAMRSSPAPMAASSPIRGSNGGAMDSDPAATPSPRKGHTRSRHTIVAWTQQPGMKRAFSIGYRADCEKCRNRVPGHFNHIIVS
ncbi:hypothetical protein SEUCBS139899_003049 [Sporothrix eucalyptigena]|uniref:Uncharacterized protein n=1 Tax=Sporothrix eucalyptigena TaxID=1812306 RepID=A0ABP0CLI5_9PEZI